MKAVILITTNIKDLFERGINHDDNVMCTLWRMVPPLWFWYRRTWLFVCLQIKQTVALMSSRVIL